jgi:hypothetical protein
MSAKNSTSALSQINLRVVDEVTSPIEPTKLSDLGRMGLPWNERVKSQVGHSRSGVVMVISRAPESAWTVTTG